jgi:hypothetical protein
MKVTELRNWLEDFREKNQEHYSRLNGLAPPRRNEDVPVSTTSEDSSPRAETLAPRPEDKDTATPSGCSFNTREELSDAESDYDASVEDSARCKEGRASRIEGKSQKARPGVFEGAPIQAAVLEETNDEAIAVLSASSFDGSYSVIRKIRSSGDRTASTGDETDVLPGGSRSWDSSSGPPSVSSWWSEEDFSAASFEHEDAIDYIATTGKLFSAGANTTASDERFRQVAFGGIQGLESNMGPDHVAILSKQATPLPSADLEDEGSVEESGSPAMKMHNASLFSNKTLTSGTLDFLCNENNASVIETSARNDVSVVSSEDGTSSTWSDDGSKPSIAPGAENSKIGKLLLTTVDSPLKQEVIGNKGELSEKSNDGKISEAYKPRRKLRDPKDLPFLQNKTVRREKPSTRPHTTPLNRGILKFGSTQKKIVERRKEELEKQWAENKAATYVKKIKWGVCQRTGTYKKKVVLDVQYK